MTYFEAGPLDELALQSSLGHNRSDYQAICILRLKRPDFLVQTMLIRFVDNVHVSTYRDFLVDGYEHFMKRTWRRRRQTEKLVEIPEGWLECHVGP
jgi:hypothetical protein